MAKGDYYCCRKCGGKIAYGPNRAEENWSPFLLCRACQNKLYAAIAKCAEELQEVQEIIGEESQGLKLLAEFDLSATQEDLL